MTSKPFIYDLDLDELEKILVEAGEPAYRARQIWQGLYVSLWRTPSEFTNLPVALRMKLDEEIDFTHLDPLMLLKSKDGETLKTLFRLPDQQAIETVLM